MRHLVGFLLCQRPPDGKQVNDGNNCSEEKELEERKEDGATEDYELEVDSRTTSRRGNTARYVLHSSSLDQ